MADIMCARCVEDARASSIGLFLCAWRRAFLRHKQGEKGGLKKSRRQKNERELRKKNKKKSFEQLREKNSFFCGTTRLFNRQLLSYDERMRSERKVAKRTHSSRER
jgi:hypothetical protein|tara:strand:- start:1595 stop:1912 length:318 start_codon:yes stop_codon:yes gene_type:complete